jgi:hypothetical protein
MRGVVMVFVLPLQALAAGQEGLPWGFEHCFARFF